MNLYVINKTFEIVGVIDAYTSLIWTTRYYSEGDFEIYLAAEKDKLDLFQEGFYIVREADMTSSGEFKNVMIIQNREIITDAESGDNLIITGNDLKSILRRRVIVNQTLLNGEVSACIRRLIYENVINPTDANRTISNFTLGSNDLINTYNMQMQITGDNLADAIAEICQAYGFGYDVFIKNSNFVFYIYEGKDRTFNQDTNPYIVFSESFDNLLSSDYKQDRSNFANVAIVAGEGEGMERKKKVVGTETGLDRIEIWVDARNASSNNGEINDAEYQKMLEQDGTEALAEKAITTEFSGEVDNTINYMINRDYFLGDLVQIENDFGISASTRIIEVIESEDDTGSNIILTFSEMEV